MASSAPILVSRCRLCELPGALVCSQCFSAVSPRLRQVERAPTRGWAAFDYQGQSREVLHLFKTTGNRRLATELVRPLLPAAVSLLRTADCRVTLVPVPSRPSAFRARGFTPSQTLATALLRLLALEGEALSCSVAELVWYQRGVGRQARLNRANRQTNLAGAMAAMEPPRSKTSRVALLMDDIVTTGATVNEARRALEAKGWSVVAFLAVAETL